MWIENCIKSMNNYIIKKTCEKCFFESGNFISNVGWMARHMPDCTGILKIEPLKINCKFLDFYDCSLKLVVQ